jgi:hypothetical protein
MPFVPPIVGDSNETTPHSLISQSHCEPFGSFGTGKQSIGSTKVALVLGNERSGSAGIDANHSKTTTASKLLPT